MWLNESKYVLRAYKVAIRNIFERFMRKHTLPHGYTLSRWKCKANRKLQSRNLGCWEDQRRLIWADVGPGGRAAGCRVDRHVSAALPVPGDLAPELRNELPRLVPWLFVMPAWPHPPSDLWWPMNCLLRQHPLSFLINSRFFLSFPFPLPAPPSCVLHSASTLSPSLALGSCQIEPPKSSAQGGGPILFSKGFCLLFPFQVLLWRIP